MRRLVELENAKQLSREFLAQRGNQVHTVDELREGGSYIAVVEDNGFYAFVHSGLEQREIRMLGDSEHFGDPGRYVFVALNKHGEIDPRQEVMFRTSGEGKIGWLGRRIIGLNKLEDGIYRITSPELIERIEEDLTLPELIVRATMERIRTQAESDLSGSEQ